MEIDTAQAVNFLPRTCDHISFWRVMEENGNTFILSVIHHHFCFNMNIAVMGLIVSSYYDID